MTMQVQQDGGGEGGGLVLPNFIVTEAGGVFAELALLPAPEAFAQAVAQLFTLGWFFQGIDYPRFIELAFEPEPGWLAARVRALQAAGKPPRQRFAAGLARMSQARVALYRGIKAVAGRVDYLFEPLTLEEEEEVPQIVENEAGEQEVVGLVRQTVQRETRLDFDELVAQMWLKGVRFGLLADEVCALIDKGESGRFTVALAMPPQPGRDAGVRELHDGLRRDDAPRLRSDGRVDLTQFRNRFPQIRAGTRLLQKLPPEAGRPGRDVSGSTLVPPTPKDFALADLVGAGTRVERDEQGEYLVAVQEGFLDIDADTNKMSVTEAIVNRDGVSLRTTGDLRLVGDSYEEHGEIQERRLVEGKSLTLHANVYGRLVSRGGFIEIKKNISGGSALNQNGPIIVEGLAVNAQLQSPQGTLNVARAEGCVLIGKKVVVHQAINCDILADEVELGEASACAVGARGIAIGRALAHKGCGNMVSVLMPDLAAIEQALAVAGSYRAGLNEKLAGLQEGVLRLREHEALRRYLTLSEKIKKGELALTPAQKPALQKLAEGVAPQLREMARLVGAQRELGALVAASQAESARLEAERTEALSRLSCRVGAIEGELIVVQRPFDAGTERLFQQPAQEVRTRLRAVAGSGVRLFVGQSGAFAWPPVAGG